QDINGALTLAGVSAYVYFFGASLGSTGGFIQLDGGQFHVSKRLWAMAAFSRFIRPRAVRVSATADDPSLQVSAFRNQDGTKVIEIINTATTQTTTHLRLDPGTAAARPTAFVTDTDRSLAVENVAQVRGRDLAVDLAPRALTTIVLRRR